MRYLVLSGVPREEFLAGDINEATDRAALSAKNNDEASVWVEVARYARSEEVERKVIPFSLDRLGHDLGYWEHVSLAESGNGDDASGSR